MRVGQRYRKQCVGTEPALVVGAIEFDQACVQPALVGRVEALQRCGNGFVDIAHRLAYAFAEVAGLVAVAQLDRFAGTGGRTRRHRRAAAVAGRQRDLGFESGIAA